MNNDALSMCGGGNTTVYPYTNIMVTPTNTMSTSTNMDTSTDMAADNLYIIINTAAFQDPWSDPDPQVIGLSFSYDSSVNANYDSDFTHILINMMSLLRITFLSYALFMIYKNNTTIVRMTMQ